MSDPVDKKVMEAFDATVPGNAIVDHIAEVHGNLVREPLDKTDQGEAQ